MARTAVRGAQIADGANGVDLTVDVTGTLPVANGGTGSVTLTSNNVLLGNGTTAVQVVAPGANGNVLKSDGTTWASSGINGLTSTATAAGSTTMSISSNTIQVWTGSTTQTVKLPTTSVAAGAQYVLINQSTGAVTVQSSGANTITILAAGTSAIFTAVAATPTTAANWNSQYLADVVTSGKKLSVSNTLTLAGTDGTTFTFPNATDTVACLAAVQTITGAWSFNDAKLILNGSSSGSSTLKATAAASGTLTLPAATDTLVGKATTDTLTNKRITARIGTTASSATPTPDADSHDQYNVTALAAGATFGAPTGTPVDGQKLLIRIKDNGTARALAYNAIYRAMGITLPTTTVISKTLYLGMVYCAVDSRWDVLAVGQEA